MIRKIRILILLGVPIIFWYASDAFPSVVKAENLRLLSGISTIIWGLVLYFSQRIGSITNIEALPSNQLQTIEFRFAHARQRIWWMAGVSLFCSFLIWAISSGEIVPDKRYMAALIGVLFGICVSYLVIFPFWFNELQSFQDKLKVSASEKVKREATLKSFSEGEKK